MVNRSFITKQLNKPSRGLRKRQPVRNVSSQQGLGLTSTTTAATAPATPAGPPPTSNSASNAAAPAASGGEAGDPAAAVAAAAAAAAVTSISTPTTTAPAEPAAATPSGRRDALSRSASANPLEARSPSATSAAGTPGPLGGGRGVNRPLESVSMQSSALVSSRMSMDEGNPLDSEWTHSVGPRVAERVRWGEKTQVVETSASNDGAPRRRLQA